MKEKTGKVLLVSSIIGGSLILGFVAFLILIFSLDFGEETTPKEEKTVEVAIKEEKPKKETAPKEEVKEETKEETASKEETTPKEEPQKTFNHTVESFTVAINEMYASVNSDTTVNPTFSEEENKAIYMITTNTALITKHDENGIINEVNVLFMMENSEEIDAINFLLASGVVIGVLNPELEKEDRGKVLTEELKFIELLEKDQGSEMAFVGSNIYELTSSRSIGGVQLTVFPSGNDF